MEGPRRSGGGAPLDNRSDRFGWAHFTRFDIRPDGSVHASDRPGLAFTLRTNALDRFRYVDGPEFAFGHGNPYAEDHRGLMAPGRAIDA
jgi:hypothetical protein